MTETRISVFVLVLLVPVSVSAGGEARGGVRGLQESECTSAYNYLAGCFTFVSGPDTIPNPTCCGGVSHLNTYDPHCLCTIIRELDNNPNVNYTKACALPLQCSLDVDVEACPALDLPPGYALAPSLPVEAGDQSSATGQFEPGWATWAVLLTGWFCISLLRIW